MIESAIKGLSNKGGPNLKQAYEELVASYILGYSLILPKTLLSYKDKFRDMQTWGHWTATGANFDWVARYGEDLMLFRNDKWEPINYIHMPLVSVTHHLPEDIYSNMGYMSAEGIRIVSGSGENVVQYFARKDDGYRIKFYEVVLMTGETVNYYVTSGRVGLCHVGRACAGEVMVANKAIYLDACYEDVEHSGAITIGNLTYDIHVKPKLGLSDLRAIRQGKDCDGLVVMINNMEFKVKFCNTVDLRFNGISLTSRDGELYPVGNTSDMISGNIYECQLIDNYYYMIRPRPDKVYPQTKYDVKFVNAAPTITDFILMFKMAGEMLIDPHLNYCPMVALKRILADAFWNVAPQTIKITPHVVFTIFHSKKIPVRRVDVISIVQELCHGKVFGMIDVSLIKAWHVYTIGYATCQEIYNEIADMGSVCTLYDMVDRSAKRMNKVVSMKKLKTMCLRGECLVFLGVPRYKVDTCGSFLPYEKNIRPDMKKVVVGDLISVWLASVRSNESVYVNHDSLDTIRLFFEEFKKDNANLEILFSFLLRWTERVLRTVSGVSAVYDENSPAWEMLFKAGLFTLELEKLKTRVLNTGCPVDHDSRIRHNCVDAVVIDKKSIYWSTKDKIQQRLLKGSLVQLNYRNDSDDNFCDTINFQFDEVNDRKGKDSI